MSRRLGIAFTLAALLVCGAALFGQCAAPGYSWRGFADDDTQAALLYDGVQVGGYDLESGTYRPLTAGAWGAPCECPAPVPAEFARRRNNFGMLYTGPAPQGSRYRLNGREVSREEAVAALEGRPPTYQGPQSFPDDSAKLCLTVIGPKAERDRVLADLDSSPALAWAKGRYKVQGYDPDNWAVARYRFVTSGRPTIYLQEPGGRDLLRVDAYPGPAELSAKLQEAEKLRSPDPNYDPAKDPGGKPALPRLPALPALGEVNPHLAGMGLIAGLALAGAAARSYRRTK